MRHFVRSYGFCERFLEQELLGLRFLLGVFATVRAVHMVTICVGNVQYRTLVRTFAGPRRDLGGLEQLRLWNSYGVHLRCYLMIV